MRILVVEDEAQLADLLRRGLVEEGHAVDLAGTGEEALDWLAVEEYDAILLDDEIVGGEPRHQGAAGVGHRGVHLDQAHARC